MHFLSFTVVVLCALATPGSCLKCYKCNSTRSASAVQTTLTSGVYVPGCSKIAPNTNIPLVECPTPYDVCVYLYAKAQMGLKEEDTKSQILGQETYEIEVRDCIRIPGTENGCSDGIDDKEAIALLKNVSSALKNVSDVEEFKNGKTCFCDTDGCDANVCEGVTIATVCIMWWALGTGIAVVVVIILSIIGCCVCCRKKKVPDEQKGAAGTGYQNQVNEETPVPMSVNYFSPTATSSVAQQPSTAPSI